MGIQMLRATPPWEWPEDADQVILKALRDPEAAEEDRLLAVELAGDYVAASDELMLALLSSIGDDDQSDELRSRSAISLGPVLEYASGEYEDADGVPDLMDYDDQPITQETYARLVDALRHLYHGGAVPDAVRRSILEASVRSPQQWHADAVRAAYHSGDDAWRLTGVFCMCYIRGFDEEILQALKSDDDEVHYHAVRAAGNWGLDGAWSHVASLVSPPHPDKDILLAAVEAVGAIRPEEAAGVLGDLLESDDEEVVEAVHEALMFAEGEMDLDDEDWDEEDNGLLN